MPLAIQVHPGAPFKLEMLPHGLQMHAPLAKLGTQLEFVG